MPDYPEKPPEEMLDKAARIREKQARGEDLTHEERGFLGAVAVAEKDIAQRKRAERAGRLEEWEQASGVESWTNAPEHARAPTISAEDARRAEAIRGKMARGEALTTEEAGLLGAVSRMRQAQD